jgi:predicted nucleic acid-binding protein
MALYPARPLLRRGWDLRANFSAPDALYVALAEALGARLLTTYARAARAIRQLTTVEAIVP